jgi:hypothetical protein
MKFSPYFKRLEVLEVKFQPWQDSDEDGFLSACGALPGEGYQEALRRTAHDDWSNYAPP